MEERRDDALTRRALHRAPAPARARTAARDATGRHGVAGRHRRRAGSPGLRRVSEQAVAAATAVAFVAGAVGAVCLDTAEREQAAAVAAATAARERAARAATERLTAEATRHAAVLEAEALTAAEAALAQASQVLGSAAPLVGEATVDPLSQAAAELAALLEAAPADRRAAAASRAAQSGRAEGAVEDVAHGAEVVSAGQDEAHGPGDATADGDATESTESTDGATSAAQDTETEPVPADVEPALDLETSARILAAAQRVAALSTQVRVLADDIAHELALAEEAAAARRAEQEAKRRAAEQAALQAALRRMSTRIRATDAAPNGEIPVELLCRPKFAHVLLRCDAARALEQLNDAYRAAFGRNLVVTDGYRTLAEQERARATKGDLAAVPGRSMHGRALAVDFSGFGSVGQFDDPDYLWMVENAAAYGWRHPPAMGPGGSGPLEPWHWEYVGR